MKNKKIFDYKDRKYNVIKYNPIWQKRFSTEVKIIRKIFGEDVSIEHIGSTSVVGMEGKPCIDILVILKKLEVVKKHISDMENMGYVYRGAFVADDALLFTRIKNNEIETNIHFLPDGHPHVKEMISLRDYLRNSKEEVQNYSKLKKELQRKYPNNYAKYRKLKDEYMEKLKKRALKHINKK